jgi:hypothetical protein
MANSVDPADNKRLVVLSEDEVSVCIADAEGEMILPGYQ